MTAGSDSISSKLEYAVGIASADATERGGFLGTTGDADDVDTEPAQCLGVRRRHESGADDPDAHPVLDRHAFCPVRRTYTHANDSTMMPYNTCLKCFGGVEGQQQTIQHGKDERAEDGAGIPSDAAQDRRSTDDGGGD